jgi:hypothetical protein
MVKLSDIIQDYINQGKLSIALILALMYYKPLKRREMAIICKICNDYKGFKEINIIVKHLLYKKYIDILSRGYDYYCLNRRVIKDFDNCLKVLEKYEITEKDLENIFKVLTSWDHLKQFLESLNAEDVDLLFKVLDKRFKEFLKVIAKFIEEEIKHREEINLELCYLISSGQKLYIEPIKKIDKIKHAGYNYPKDGKRRSIIGIVIRKKWGKEV